MIDQHKLKFDLLTDKGNRVAQQYGVMHKLPSDLRELYLKFGIDLAKFNGDDSWTLPIPARFVIDINGVIRAVDTDPDYTVRPEPDETLRVLKSLSAR